MCPEISALTYGFTEYLRFWYNLRQAETSKNDALVPETGIEPVRPLFTKAADFKSDVSTYFTTRARIVILLEARPGVEPG